MVGVAGLLRLARWWRQRDAGCRGRAGEGAVFSAGGNVPAVAGAADRRGVSAVAGAAIVDGAAGVAASAVGGGAGDVGRADADTEVEQ